MRHKVHSLILIVFNFLLPIFLMVLPLSFTRPFFLSIASIFLLLEGRYRRLIKCLLIYGLMYALFLVFTYSGDTIIKSFFYGALIVWMGFMPVFMTSTILIFDKTPSELLASLQLLHLPKPFIIALTIAFRYIPTFQQESKTLKENMTLRGLEYSYKQPLKRFEYFVVPSLFRSMLVAEELTAAGLIKGIDSPQKRTTYIDTSFHPIDILLSIVITTGILFAFFL